MTDEKERTVPSKKGVSRREFIAGTVGGVMAGAVVGAAGSLGFPKTVTAASQSTAVSQVSTDQSSIPTTWDKAADVIVCGSGATGLPAAVAAAEAGASVILVESGSVLGGAATISGGSLGIGGGNALQIKAGIVETAATIYSDLTQHLINYSNVVNKTLATTSVEAAPGGKNDPSLARVFADRSLDTWNWLVAHGAKFSGVTASTGASIFWGTRAYTNCTSDVVDPTGLGAINPLSKAGGAGWCNPMITAVKKLGVDIELNTKMTEIIRQGVMSGRVLGVGAETAMKTLYFKANKAVILATGGWKGHKWLRTLMDPRLGPTMSYSGMPFVNDDGSGLMAALDAGAALQGNRGLDLHGWHRHWGTMYHSFPLGSPYAVPGLSPSVANYIFVNSSGKRFIDETTPETTGWFFGNPPFSFYDIALDQNTFGPYGTPGVWTIFDSAAATRQGWNTATWFNGVVDPNLVFSAPTASGLATAIGVDPTALSTTITNYNSYVVAGSDPDFGRAKTALLYQINTSPYYAVWTSIQIHDTTGGVAINSKSQVLDIYGYVIPSLYAGGEAAGGLDLIGMAKGVIQGRIAGENAATEQSW
jgi:succinate dehydrogenase/fumarate reductase flavoprotein subunit